MNKAIIVLASCIFLSLGIGHIASFSDGEALGRTHHAFAMMFSIFTLGISLGVLIAVSAIARDGDPPQST